MFDVYIGRAGKGFDGRYGNPHPVNKPCPVCYTGQKVIHAKGEAMSKFSEYFHLRIEADEVWRTDVLTLRGKVLGCFCLNKDGSGACHGLVIAEWLDSQ